jgi:hypothetical protein
MSKTIVWRVRGAVLIAMACWGLQASHSGPPPASAPVSQETIVETFVLTPIRMECVDMEVPAQVYGPLRNNSCGGWAGRTESCYLPGRTLGRAAAPDRSELDGLLERHLSAWIGAWRSGAWPAAGGSICFDLKRYSSVEHVWLASRITIREGVGGGYLGGQDDPVQWIRGAATQPAAELEIEVFDGVRNANGYPHIIDY